jgi:predicted RNA binding protein YcfA (HicA-like mRNA interferase family)
MGKLPVLSGREVVKILNKIGYEPTRQKGSHIILVKKTSESKTALVVPDHKEVDPGTLIEIIRQAGLKRDEFMKLLK